MRPSPFVVLFAAFSTMAFSITALADVDVSPLVGDHMVLQRGASVRVSGRAEQSEVVSVTLGDHAASAAADGQGRWIVDLGAVPPGGPHRLTIKGRNTLSFEDVLVGDVWVASGQSNMEWPLTQTRHVDEALAAGCEGLRLFTVAKAAALAPAEDVEGRWAPCDAPAALGFSAVAFHFGQQIAASTGVPIGLVNASWGGTPAEAWTPREALEPVPSLGGMVQEFDRLRTDPALRASYAARAAEWEKANFPQDTLNRGADRGWARLDFDDGAWKTMAVPQYWESAGLAIDGAVWFRREVDVPGEWEGKDLALELGALDDFDRTYWNGVTVGQTDERTPRYYSHPRSYAVPGRLVMAGRNVVAVRVFDRYGNGGFGGTPMALVVKGPGRSIGLAGEWRYAVEQRLEPSQPDFSTQPPEPPSESNPMSPTVLWNAMIAPLTKQPIRGVIWYQGETNAPRAYQYRTLFPAMIGAWRKAWGSPELPFLFVQLANWRARVVEPGESDWAELREAQSMTLSLPGTGMATAIDIGEADDIHPRNKRDVGHRLALVARARVYGQAVEFEGPTYRGFAVEGNAVRIRFSHAAGLRTPDGAAPSGFAVAGRDRRWKWATAWIEGDDVVVMSPEVTAPVAVRYAWGDNPAVNLTNGVGLPALPFRTDEGPGVTQPKAAR